MFDAFRADVKQIWGFPRQRPASQRHVVVLIDRGKSRRFKNTESLRERILSSLPVDLKIYGEGLSQKSGAAMFASANLVLGYHGAGVSNLIFSSPGTVSIEIMKMGCENSVRQSFSNRMADGGFVWEHLVVGVAGGSCHYPDPVDFRDSDLDIIVQRLQYYLGREQHFTPLSMFSGREQQHATPLCSDTADLDTLID